MKDIQELSQADIFFLYPTTYLTKRGNDQWNADVHDEKLNHFTDASTILYQASLFNGVGKVYAPRYRQVHYHSFFTKDSASAEKAFDLAYGDIRSAFEYFLEHFNKNRPIILAGQPEVTSRDVFAQPTIENGVLTSIYGREVIASANMHRAKQDTTYGLKANSAGKLDLDTAANNLYGAILAVRWDQWIMGFKRRMSFETMRVPRADATEITVLMRVGLAQRDTEASAITYYVGV